MSSSSAASRSGSAVACLRLELAAELLVLALEQRCVGAAVDRAVLGGGHEPGARVVRDARLRPLLERGDERVLRQLLGEADVAHDPREPGDEPGRLDPPDRLDGAVDVAHGCSASPIGRSARRAYCCARSAARSRSLLLLELGRQLVAEVLGLEDLPDLDLGPSSERGSA